MKFKANFITYLGTYRSIETEKLNIPTSEGRRTILSNHMPIMIPMGIGVIETLEDGKLHHYIVNNGVLYFENNVAEIVADNVVDVNEIDIERSKSALIKYEEALNKAKRENERVRAKEKLDIAKVMLKAAEEYKDEL